MGGRGSAFDTAREIVGQYSITSITKSKADIVALFRDYDKNGGVRIDQEERRIKITREAGEKADALAKELSERMMESREQDQRDYKDIRDSLRGTYTISEKDRSNIADFGAYVRSRENMVKIGKSGISLDSKYQELASRYPQYFDARRDTNPADQLQRINTVLGQLRTGRQLPAAYRNEAKKELRNDLIRHYLLNKQREARKRGA